MMKSSEAAPVNLGSQEAANKRTIYKFIHQGGIQSCQLVMGLTALEPGSVWNSFPPHTHWRRTEIYFYFDLGDERARRISSASRRRRAMCSCTMKRWRCRRTGPCTSAVGTGNYKFIWGMAGENQVV